MELDESDPKVILFIKIFLRFYLRDVHQFYFNLCMLVRLSHLQIIIAQFIRHLQEEVFYQQQVIQLILLCT